MIPSQLKCFLSRHRCTWGDTTDSALTRLAMASAAMTKVSCRIRHLHVYIMAAWRMQKGDTLESTLPIGAFQKEAILF